jgi:hypothetical protein
LSTQEVPVASQKFTWPVVTGTEPVKTVAVRVTTVPGRTLVVADPPALAVRDVTVALGGGAAPALRQRRVPSMAVMLRVETRLRLKLKARERTRAAGEGRWQLMDLHRKRVQAVK